MRQVQKKGPYTITGYSYGACVAFEMATQLEAASQQVACLFLLDGTYTFKTEHSGDVHSRTGLPITESTSQSDAICLFMQQFMSFDYAKVNI